MSDDIFVETEVQLLSTEFPFKITFTDKKGRELGRLEEDEHGQLVFNGKITESADIFFQAVVQLNARRIRELRELLLTGYEVVEDFMPNVSQCVLQDYGRLNDFLMKAKDEFSVN